MPRTRLAIDIGGTFTDVVLERPHGRHTTKVLTTPEDPARGVLDAIERVLAAASTEARDIDLIIHGTTLATNALIERRGARTALVTTEGHRDVLEMAYENRFEQYDVDIDRPAPLVPRHLRFTVHERCDARGAVLVPLADGDVDALLPRLDEARIESIAIGLLHGYANPAHEQRIAERIAIARPRLSLTLASSVCPEIREFERFSTAVANAYVKPLMARYLTALEAKLAARGFRCPCLMMTSGGGLTTLATAREFPIRLVESGPAGGAILAAHVGRALGIDRVMSFDMGGTTAKLCLIDDGAPQTARAFEVDRTYRFKKGSGLPVRIPVIEMVEIGAGGGSIAGVDRLGRIFVGPDSAGSDPGPACYARGGTAATVTDADVVLGCIDAERFAGGDLPLDRTAAVNAVARAIGEPLALDAPRAAAAIAEVVDEQMALAARAHAVEWGKDAAGRTLIAFGGAAPLHAARVAEKLGIDRIVVPCDASVGSAIGFLLAPIAYEVVRSRHALLSTFAPEPIDAAFAEMRAEAEAVVAVAAPGSPLIERRDAYMRYVGQGYEIAVAVPSGRIEASHAHALRRAFDDAYRALYGRLVPNLDVEALSWTLTLSVASREALGAGDAATISRRPTRSRLFDGEREIDVPCSERTALAVGERLAGPALIVEDQTTTVVAAGFMVERNARGDLILQRESR